MIGYYYKSESDVLFRRVSLEHEQRTSLDKQNSNINNNNNNNFFNKTYLNSNLFE